MDPKKYKNSKEWLLKQQTRSPYHFPDLLTTGSVFMVPGLDGNEASKCLSFAMRKIERLLLVGCLAE